MVAIIPARGGSKGIKNKNIKTLCGKPLIAHSIECCKQSQYIDRVIVSTNSKVISLVANTYGAEVILRPHNISGDKAISEDALLHVLSKIKRPKSFVFMQCTSPLTIQEDLDSAIDYFHEHEADCVFSVTPFYGFIWQRGHYGLECLNNEFSTRPMRQNQLLYKETGAFYVINTESFLQSKRRIHGKALMYQVSKERSIDIDDIEDFRYCEYLIGKDGANQ